MTRRKAKSPRKHSPQRRKGTKKRSLRRLLKRVVKWGFVTGIWAVIILALYLGYLGLSLPSIETLTHAGEGRAIVLLDRHGEEFHRFGSRFSQAVDIAALPEHVPQAVIAIEDRRFFRHSGIDLKGIARALWVDLRAMAFVQGGSTITQQLAKNLFLTPERTVSRKLREALLALKIERHYTKDEILSAYLSRVYFGGGAYGISAAAQLYFDRSAEDLTLSQAALLAGLLKAPSRFSPRHDIEAALSRARVVLKVMRELEMADAGSKLVVTDIELRQGQQLSGKDSYRYFADWILDQLEAYAAHGQENLVVKTTYEPTLQEALAEQINDTIREHGEAKSITQGAGIIMTNEGALRALVGGNSYQESQFNRAVDAIRQPGSAFKPLVYAAGFAGGRSPDDLILDAPIIEGRYRPQNFGGTYRGDIPLRDALAFSSNTATIRLAKETGLSPIKRIARQFGITETLRSDLSLALGSSEVSLLSLSTVYAGIASGGLAVEPYGVLEIETEGGETLYKYEPAFLHRVLQPQARADLAQAMQGVTAYGTGRGAALADRAVAGKTGTSQDYRDAWFLGYTSYLTGGIWLGNDDNSAMAGVTGGSYPARIWRAVMTRAHAGLPVRIPAEAAPVSIQWDTPASLQEEEQALQEIQRRQKQKTSPLDSLLNTFRSREKHVIPDNRPVYND